MTTTITEDHHRVEGYDITVITKKVVVSVDFTRKGGDDKTTRYETEYHARHMLAAELAEATAKLLAPPS